MALGTTKPRATHSFLGEKNSIGAEGSGLMLWRLAGAQGKRKPLRFVWQRLSQGLQSNALDFKGSRVEGECLWGRNLDGPSGSWGEMSKGLLCCLLHLSCTQCLGTTSKQSALLEWMNEKYSARHSHSVYFIWLLQPLWERDCYSFFLGHPLYPEKSNNWPRVSQLTNTANVSAKDEQG